MTPEEIAYYCVAGALAIAFLIVLVWGAQE